jgi:predicted small lipoprotein YifL
MRRAVGLLLAVIVLAGCGNKSALYLPPEKDSQQNGKSSSRQ